MCQVWYIGIQGIYARLQRGLICHRYMCIVLYIYRSAKFWCSSIQGIYAQLMGSPSVMGIYAMFYIYIDLPVDVPSLV